MSAERQNKLFERDEIALSEKYAEWEQILRNLLLRGGDEDWCHLDGGEKVRFKNALKECIKKKKDANLLPIVEFTDIEEIAKQFKTGRAMFPELESTHLPYLEGLDG